MNDEMLICCEHCDGEGRLLTSWGRALHPCPMCEGTGCEIIETTLVEFDDFEECWGR
jgi:hypothetical protein